jgi:hypothetical protein
MPEKTKKISEEHEEILKLSRKRFSASIAAESRYRHDAVIDRRFVDGDQWPRFVRKRRKNKVIATVNKTRIMRNSVVGRAMDINVKPKVEPKEGGDAARAEIFDNIITDIFEKSKFDRVKKSVVKDSATSGIGFFVIRPEFDATGFYQHLLVKHVPNPLTVYLDQTATELLYDDARWGFITGVLSEEEFEFEYPNAKVTSFDYSSRGDRGRDINWYDEEGIVVAEYYYRVPQKVQRAQMETGEIFELDEEITEELIESTIIPGSITEATPDGITYKIAEIKEVSEFTVKWAKVTGAEVIEGPIDLKISKIPIIPAIGYDENIEGRRVSRGIVYDMRDPQRMYNYHYSSEAEIISNQTRAPFTMFDDMLDDNTRPMWDKMSIANPPYLLVKRTAGNILPRRELPPQSSGGNINYMERADSDMKDVTGIFSSAIGQPDNARSKVAINARQIASGTNTRIIIDNWIEATLEVGRRLIEWIPIIYDTERIILIKGEDGTRTPVVINKTVFDSKSGEKLILNNLKEGVYDYVIQAGTAGMTSRQEQLIAIQEFTQNLPPELKVMFSDVVAELSNMPGEIIERMKKIIQGFSQQQPEQPVTPEVR